MVFIIDSIGLHKRANGLSLMNWLPPVYLHYMI